VQPALVEWAKAHGLGDEIPPVRALLREWGAGRVWTA
jgi:hypothetical protein